VLVFPEWLVPFLFKSVGGMVLSALVDVAVDQTIGENIKPIVDNRRKQKAFTKAISLAHYDFKRHHRELAASFFDEHFIQNHAIHELKLLLAPTGEPNAERLAGAFAQQFRRPIAGIREPATEFIRYLEERLVVEPELRDLIPVRYQEKTYRSVQRIEKILLSKLPSYPAPDGRLDRSLISVAFGGASKALLDWPQATAGRWIDRPELEKLKKAFSSS